MSIDIRLLTADDDLEPELELSERAFGPVGESRRSSQLAAARRGVSAGRLLGAFDGSALVGAARYYDMRQWWQGRSLPMAGVAGVKVAPEEQGRGVGRSLMTGLLEQIAARGYPLSVLYPATSSLYRSLGWELAGGQYEITVPARSLRALQPPDPQAIGPDPAGAGLAGAVAEGAVPAGAVPDLPPVRRAGPADAAEMIAVAGRLYAGHRDCGPATFDAPTLAGRIDAPETYCYLAPDGELIYQWDEDHGEMLALRVAAGSAGTARTLWSILGSHATIVSGVRARVSPADPVSWLAREPDVTMIRRQMWMLRLVDAPAAIAGRGFPATAAAAVPLDVQDGQLPANSGAWLLEVGGGLGALTRRDGAGAARGAGLPLRLGARGLAALYAGTPLAALRGAGLVTGGGPAADAALDGAFAGAPFMYDSF